VNKGVLLLGFAGGCFGGRRHGKECFGFCFGLGLLMLPQDSTTFQSNASTFYREDSVVSTALSVSMPL
jgi:hypothetical protein